MANLLTSALAKSARAFASLFRRDMLAEELTPAFLDELQNALILADFGVQLSERLIGEIRRECSSKGLKTSAEVKQRLKERLINLLSVPESPTVYHPEKLNLFLFAGVNGVGKTTFLAKLAYKLMQSGVGVLCACADTFRAAASEQLEIWGRRAGFEVISAPRGSDPGSVVYAAIERALREGKNAVLIDTAGRMQTKKNLMDELGKISRAGRKAYAKYSSPVPSGGASENLPALAGSSSRQVSQVEDLIHEVNFLILDATTGQNAVEQAKVFSEAVHLTGIVLNKIDTTAKGGVIFPVVEATRLPVLFLGCGESLNDILEFDAGEFVENLLCECA